MGGEQMARCLTFHLVLKYGPFVSVEGSVRSGMGEAHNLHVVDFHNVVKLVLCKATRTGSAFAALQKRHEAHNLHGRLTTRTDDNMV
jgi:hypothetical protein